MLSRMIGRVRSVPRWVRLLLGSILQLKNWRELVQGTTEELRGRGVAGSPVLLFRSGLEITLVPGGYGGYYLLFPEIFIDRCYQPTRRFAVRRGWMVVDIGANMGLFTCQAATAAPEQ